MPQSPLERHSYPLLEYDPSPGVIEPQLGTDGVTLPERAVVCFFNAQVEQLASEGRVSKVTEVRSEMGVHPIYLLSFGGQDLALFHPGVGAPLASGLLEEVIARGCRKFVVCGACGVLDREVAVGHLLVLVDALRDEGTSYHYLPPGRTVAASPEAVEAISRVLEEKSIPFLQTRAWTTDAFYRETHAKVVLRREEGCLCVEMEAAALFAVARFRGVTLGQFLYAGDDVSGEAWDTREWTSRRDLREEMIWLAAEACTRL